MAEKIESLDYYSSNSSKGNLSSIALKIISLKRIARGGRTPNRIITTITAYFQRITRVGSKKY